MRLSVKESSVVRPIAETPSGSVWLSSLDLLMPANHHTRIVYFYRSDGAVTFFNAAVLKEALARVPADCDAQLDELGGFGPRNDIALIPKVDYSQGISSFPLLLLQLTRFKCGSICLGVANEHHVSDGISALHFINKWSDTARGLTASSAVPPFFDRSLLSPRVPPQPYFPHVEYQPQPPLKTPLPNTTTNNTSHSTFTLTPDLLNSLKHKCSRQNESSYTTFEVVAGHVWRCVCAARSLPGDQETKVQIAVDGRSRLQPPLQHGFFGNTVFFMLDDLLI
ncbi:shikimate O-hydroxycinnamoyltransferase [Salvia divinorum]|uniref:Shikimate O-hydroxycinnamoyltransferase n=1 Tax=Salvia divinorum TaxID=28513 RepID=A0ABD1HCV5_SALDI